MSSWSPCPSGGVCGDDVAGVPSAGVLMGVLVEVMKPVGGCRRRSGAPELSGESALFKAERSATEGPAACGLEALLPAKPDRSRPPPRQAEQMSDGRSCFFR